MRPALALPLLCTLLGAPAAAEIYRCADAGGGVRFVDDPSACPGATKHELRRELQRDATPPAPAPPAAPDPAPDLEALLPDRSEVGSEWQITREQLVTEVEPEQRRWGVLETQARHYGRTRDGVTEVCTIELWRFASTERATAAAAGLSFPGWHFEARGTLVVTLRGTRFERGRPFEKGLFPDCRALAARVRA